NGQTGANGDKQVSLFGSLHCARNHLRIKSLSKRNGCALQDASAAFALRIFFSGSNAIKRGLHGPTPSALHTHDIMDGAVHFYYFLGRIAGALVQAINILSDQRMKAS